MSTEGGVRDLLVVVPSRGRPAQLQQLIMACADWTGCLTDIVVGLDDDDPQLDAYRLMLADCYGIGVTVRTGPRQSLTGWTNQLIAENLDDYWFFASLGDDHRPRTPWDRVLIEAIDTELDGTGLAFGDDLAHGGKLATAPVVSRDIVAALGWLCEPTMHHYCVDNVWTDLAARLDKIVYKPEVIVEHLHPAFGKGEIDQTYNDAGGFSTSHPDYQAYLYWQEHKMEQDLDLIRAIL